MRNKIAIVGSGISGLSAAYALRDTANITLFEADTRLGGHSNTVDVDLGDWSGPVDTGFIVFNHVNYPNLVRLFDELGVKTKLSDMHFSVSIADGKREFTGRNLLAGAGNWLRPRLENGAAGDPVRRCRQQDVRRPGRPDPDRR